MVNKGQSQALLSELVDSCIKEIEEHRQNRSQDIENEGDFYQPGETVEIYDEGNTVVRRGKEERKQEDTKNQADDKPFFMQHIAKYGLNYSDKDYAQNFSGDYEDKARYMHEKYIAQNVENEESKFDSLLKEETKAASFNKEDNWSKDNENENGKNGKYRLNQKNNSINLSNNQLTNQPAKEYLIRNQDPYSDNPKDITIKNLFHEKEELRRLAAEQYSSSSDSFNWERNFKPSETAKNVVEDDLISISSKDRETIADDKRPIISGPQSQYPSTRKHHRNIALETGRETGRKKDQKESEDQDQPIKTVYPDSSRYDITRGSVSKRDNVLDFDKFPVEILHGALQTLQTDMEKQIEKVMKKYQKMMDPIKAAIRRKKYDD